MFRTGYEEEEESEAGTRKKPKWVLIGGIAVGVVGIALAITIPMLSRGKSANLPPAPASPATALGVDQGTSALKPPAGTVSSPAATGATSPNLKPAAGQPVTTSDYDYSSNSQAPVSPDQMNQQLTATSQLPEGARKPAPVDTPPPSGFGVPGLDTASALPVVGGALPGARVKIAPISVSAGVAGGMLIRKTPPTYPAIAKAARVAGTVILAATISKSGFVTNVQVVSGPQMLRQSAIDAVKEWRYRPYLLNNQPMEVQTTINVDFNL
jgi:TonB family protein